MHSANTAAPRSDLLAVSGGDRLLTIGELAKLTGLAVGSLYHLVSQRRIPFVRISARCIRFQLSAIFQWWDELTEEPNPQTK